MSDTPPPKRRFAVKIEIGADDWQALKSALKGILFDAERREGPPFTITSGGYDSGYTVACEEDSEMTHDRYMEAIDVWLKEQEARR